MTLIDAAQKLGKAFGVLDDPLGTHPPWSERLQGSIRFKSPKGDKYEFFWIGDPRTVDKRVVTFDLPFVPGTIAHDLATTGSRFTLTFYASGPNNDLISRAFVKTFRLQRGAWEVDHPTQGKLRLQPLSLTHDDQPVESGNLTRFTSEWLEVLDPATLKTFQDAASLISGEVDLANMSSLEDAAPLTDYEGPPVLVAARAVDNAIKSISSVFDDVQQTNADINAAMLESYATAQSAVAAPTIAVSSMVGSLRSMSQLPALIEGDASDRLGQFSDAIASMFDLMTPAYRDAQTVEARRAWLITSQTVIGGAICGAANTVGSASISTRQQAISMAETLAQMFNDVIEFLASHADGEDVMMSAFAPTSRAVSYAIRHAIVSTYDVIPDRRIVLSHPRAPIEIAISEMLGEDGDIDAALDKLIKLNDLSGEDLLLIPINSEIIVNA